MHLLLKLLVVIFSFFKQKFFCYKAGEEMREAENKYKRYAHSHQRENWLKFRLYQQNSCSIIWPISSPISIFSLLLSPNKGMIVASKGCSIFSTPFQFIIHYYRHLAYIMTETDMQKHTQRRSLTQEEIIKGLRLKHRGSYRAGIHTLTSTRERLDFPLLKSLK